MCKSLPFSSNPIFKVNLDHLKNMTPDLAEKGQVGSSVRRLPRLEGRWEQILLRFLIDNGVCIRKDSRAELE